MSPERQELARVPWPIHPASLFVVAQLAPFLLWAFVPERTFSAAVYGAVRAPLGAAAVAAYALLLVSFCVGTRLGERAFSYTAPELPPAWIIGFAHYFAVALSVVSAGYILVTILRSPVNPFAVVIAAQANVLKDVVYTDSVVSQVSIMGRHLVLAALVTWFVRKGHENRAPATLLPILLVASVLFVFTSSRLTSLALVLICVVFLFGYQWPHLPVSKRWRLTAAVIVVAVTALTGLFALGVLTRSLGTWTDTAGAEGVMAAAGYEAVAYFASPVNYSVAFVEEGIAFVNGLGLANFFHVVFTVFNLPVDYSYREPIAWYYESSLDRVGLLGEWFAIAGPFFWLPTLAYGFLAGVFFRAFRLKTLAGQLVYPIMVVAIVDSMRGFLLAENIIVANVLYGLAVAIAARARIRIKVAVPVIDH
jgi:hypothetical protein